MQHATDDLGTTQQQIALKVQLVEEAAAGFVPGARVATEFGGPGRLHQRYPDGAWSIQNDDGDRDAEVPVCDITLLGNADYTVGDTVMARWKPTSPWNPAAVIAMNGQLITVKFEGEWGDLVELPPKQVTKIIEEVVKEEDQSEDESKHNGKWVTTACIALRQKVDTRSPPLGKIPKNTTVLVLRTVPQEFRGFKFNRLLVKTLIKGEEVKGYVTERLSNGKVLLKQVLVDHWAPEKVQSSFKTIFKKLLNKLSDKNFHRLVPQFEEVEVIGAKGQPAAASAVFKMSDFTPEQMDEIVGTVFETALVMKVYCPCYARLCSELSARHPKFRAALLRNTKRRFDSHITWNSVDASDAEAEYTRTKLRDQSVGIAQFVGQLFLVNLVGQAALCKCIDQLWQRVNAECAQSPIVAENLELVLTLLKEVGQEVDRQGGRKRLDKDFAQLDHVRSLAGLPKKIMFDCLDLLDLRKRRWQPKQKLQARKQATRASPFPKTHVHRRPAPRKRN